MIVPTRSTCIIKYMHYYEIFHKRSSPYMACRQDGSISDRKMNSSIKVLSVNKCSNFRGMEMRAGKDAEKKFLNKKKHPLFKKTLQKESNKSI